MDVMLPPQLDPKEIFSGFTFDVKVPNVQSMIDESEKQRRETNSADFFSNFQTYSAITTWLDEQVQKGGNKVARFSIGKTHLGKDINALRLGVEPKVKPTIVIQCGIHAREWVAVSTCCWMIDQLLTKDLALLDNFLFVIVPVLNVDGYEYTHTNDRLWRKNRQPTAGSTCLGTDLNRNYGIGWSGPGGSSNPCSETYYGSAAFSGPETTAIRNLLRLYITDKTLISYFDIHAYSGLWMSPWGYICNAVPKDYPTMEGVMSISTAAVRSVNGRAYKFGPTCTTIYQTSGGSRDYSYGDAGVVHSYGVEAFGTNFTPPTSYIPEIGSEIWAGVRQTALLIGRQ